MGLVAAPVLRAEALEGSGEDGREPAQGQGLGCWALGVRAAPTEACQCLEASGEASRVAGAGVHTGHCPRLAGSGALSGCSGRVCGRSPWCCPEPRPLGPAVPSGLGRPCTHVGGRDLHLLWSGRLHGAGSQGWAPSPPLRPMPG